MSPSFKRLLVCLAGFAAACGGDGNDVSAPSQLNVPPIASFGSSCSDLACTFSDSSSDADGRIVAYRWSFGDGSGNETARDAEHIYSAPNTYTVALTVTDDDGATDSIASTVHAILPPPPPPNALPVASFGSPCIDLTCSFIDSSSDPDGTVVSHHWAFGDGETSDVPSPGHIYAAAGVYHAELAVTDDRGGTAGAVRDVTVASPCSEWPPRVQRQRSRILLPPGINPELCATRRACAVHQHGRKSAEMDGGERALDPPQTGQRDHADRCQGLGRHAEVATGG